MLCTSCQRSCHVNCVPNLNNNEAELLTNWICLSCISKALPFNKIIENSDFIQTISESWVNKQPLELQRLQDRVFNPFEINDDNILLPTNDIDPDVQFFDGEASVYKYGNSNYFFKNTFNDKCSQLSLDSTNISLLHLKIRSMVKNLCTFELYLNSLNFDFTILCLTETWLRQSKADLYGISGYRHECEYRQDRNGGGVSIFIKDFIDYKKRSELTGYNSYMESIFIEISKTSINCNKNVIISIIYRPPGTDNFHFQ